jgi:uncharacterized membrane protein YeiH
MKTLPTQRLVLVADLLSVSVFALQGAVMAIQNNLDLLGVMVLSFVAALGGGILRDLLIGASPPQALKAWWYPALAIGMGALTFVFHRWAMLIPPFPLTGIGAVGLGLAAVAGTEKTLAYGLHPFIAVLIGGLNGVGGGVIRDLMLNHIPTVLRADILATAAMFGAVVLITAQNFGLPARWAAILGGGACIVLRLVSVWQHWSLPHIQGF